MVTQISYINQSWNGFSNSSCLSDTNFWCFFGYIIMDEKITWKVLVSLIIIISGIFMVKRGNKGIQE